MTKEIILGSALLVNQAIIRIPSYSLQKVLLLVQSMPCVFEPITFMGGQDSHLLLTPKYKQQVYLRSCHL